MNKYEIKTIYKNKDDSEIVEHVYPLMSYCQNLKKNTVHIIRDVEDTISKTLVLDKNKWDDQTLANFEKIRHELLDIANAIYRIPTNMLCDGKNINAIDVSEFIAQKLS